jgi:hypothetical protein
MLTVTRPVARPRATNPQYGNIETFLERLLVEVVAGNYRHFLHERVAFSARPGNESKRPEELCWPPLLAIERQVSGLFFSALSSVCPVSRPEQRVRRPILAKGRKAPKESAGRIDFAALYGSRHIGLELKQIPISSLKAGSKQGADDLRGMAAKWKKVSHQASTALQYMRDYPLEYHHPITIGLLVIRVSRKVSSRRDPNELQRELSAQLPEIVGSVQSSIKPDFLAYYQPPPEMQVLLGNWGNGREDHRVFPGVIFAASVHMRQPSRKAPAKTAKREPQKRTANKAA